ncbi:hypothetical protein MRB53_039774 [Persea americana]|nr:hypothetical protein MRB53_039774 [Persea americana]
MLIDASPVYHGLCNSLSTSSDGLEDLCSAIYVRFDSATGQRLGASTKWTRALLGGPESGRFEKVVIH